TRRPGYGGRRHKRNSIRAIAGVGIGLARIGVLRKGDARQALVAQSGRLPCVEGVPERRRYAHASACLYVGAYARIDLPMDRGVLPLGRCGRAIHVVLLRVVSQHPAHAREPGTKGENQRSPDESDAADELKIERALSCHTPTSLSLRASCLREARRPAPRSFPL